MNAREIIVDALEQLNKLSPGETLNADLAAFCLRRLNTLVDEWSANALFLYRTVTTSVAQTGNAIFGAGAWAAIAPGSEIVSVAVNGFPVQMLTANRYNTLVAPTTSGQPWTYTYDGLSALNFYPVPTGQTIRLETRSGVQAFADIDADYIAPQGFKAALGVSLAIRCAPTLLGGVPAPLVNAERRALMNIQRPDPAIVDVLGFTRGGRPYNVFTNG